MSFIDILRLALRNLREAKLRATLTSMGVIVGVAVIVTMVSFGLGLQRNMLSRFRALDLFNEMRVFGKNVFTMASPNSRRVETPGDRRGPSFRPDKAPTRILDDAAVAEITKIPGVAYVEPTVTLVIYVRANGRSQMEFITGASVPNASSRFKELTAGRMIGSPDADEAVVTEKFAEDFGFQKPEDAIGKAIEFLAAPKESAKSKTAEEEPPSFFGLPLERDAGEGGNGALVVKTFRIAGVLNTQIKEGAGQGGLRGLLPGADIYLPLAAAHRWSIDHRGPMNQVAVVLARVSLHRKDRD